MSVLANKYRQLVTFKGMAKAKTHADEVKALAKAKGILRARDLAAGKIPRTVLSRLCASGELTRTGRGLYVSATGNITEKHTLAQVAKVVPHGVVCLLSALQFHGLTTQIPGEVWLAIPPKARRPRQNTVSIHAVYFSGPSLKEGIEEHVIENVPVRVYSAAKTVADCFKARNKVGLDVALEALRDYWRKRKGTVDELWHHAKVCRVSNVMKPYLESLA